MSSNRTLQRTVAPTTITGLKQLPQRSPLLLGVLALLWGATALAGVHLNAIIVAIVIMLALCMAKVPVTVALLIGGLCGGIQAGLGFGETITVFNDNILGGAQVGLTYVLVGALAVALSRSGLIELFAAWISKKVGAQAERTSSSIKWMLFGLLLAFSLASQNIVPVHIAFIPILIPPLLSVFNQLRIDRRAIACVLAGSISAAYLLLPVGFGAIYLDEILIANVNEFGTQYGLSAEASIGPKAMALPVLGILVGMLVAVVFTYRKPRDYGAPLPNSVLALEQQSDGAITLRAHTLVFTLLALVVTLLMQFWFDSLMFGALFGFIVLSISGAFRWDEQDDVFTQGLVMMAKIAVIITVASGFAGVLNATGDVAPLVSAITNVIGENKALAAFLMLMLGLFITLGFGDSFASVPILAPIYLPLALQTGFSPLGAICLLGAAAALGDAGSPASTISLGATSGLAADGRHDHMRDTVIPTFMHSNFGMLLFAWIGAMIL